MMAPFSCALIKFPNPVQHTFIPYWCSAFILIVYMMHLLIPKNSHNQQGMKLSKHLHFVVLTSLNAL